MLQIFLITLLPTVIGMAIRQQFPDTACRLEQQMSRLAIGLLALIVVLLLASESSRLPGFLVQAGIGVVLLNLLAKLTGFLAGKVFRLSPAQQISMADKQALADLA